MRKKTVEKYLEIIFILQNRMEYAQTGDIAKIMEIKAPSVTEMLQKLEKEGLILYTMYKGAKLTEKGLKIAKELQQKHVILSEFLVMLGVDKEIAEIDACSLEHHISDLSMEKLTKFLEFIKNAPDRPIWLQHFDEFLKTGIRPKCQYKNDKQ